MSIKIQAVSTCVTEIFILKRLLHLNGREKKPVYWIWRVIEFISIPLPPAITFVISLFPTPGHNCGDATIATFSYLPQPGKIRSANSSKETIDRKREILIQAGQAFMEQTPPRYFDIQKRKNSVLKSLGLNENNLLQNAPVSWPRRPLPRKLMYVNAISYLIAMVKEWYPNSFALPIPDQQMIIWNVVR